MLDRIKHIEIPHHVIDDISLDEENNICVKLHNRLYLNSDKTFVILYNEYKDMMEIGLDNDSFWEDKRTYYLNGRITALLSYRLNIQHVFVVRSNPPSNSDPGEILNRALPEYVANFNLMGFDVVSMTAMPHNGNQVFYSFVCNPRHP